MSYVVVQAVSAACENLLNQVSGLPMFLEIFDWAVFAVMLFVEVRGWVF